MRKNINIISYRTTDAFEGQKYIGGANACINRVNSARIDYVPENPTLGDASKKAKVIEDIRTLVVSAKKAINEINRL